MAENMSIGVGELLVNVLPDSITQGFSFLVTLAQVAGVLFIIYLAFLITQAIIKIRQAVKIRSIEKNVAEINQKLDKIINSRFKSKK